VCVCVCYAITVFTDVGGFGELEQVNVQCYNLAINIYCSFAS